MKILLFLTATISSLSSWAQNPILKSNNVNIIVASGTQLVLQGGLKMEANAPLVNNGEILLLPSLSVGLNQNWENATAFNQLTGTGKVILRGNNVQNISGANLFYDIYVENTNGGVQINNDIEISNSLKLDNGLIKTIGGSKVLVSNTNVNSVFSTTAYNKSWINGILERKMAGNLDTYLFPIGKLKAPNDTLYAPIRLKKYNAVATPIFTAEYFPAKPFDRLNILTPLDHISDVEYWHVYSNTFASANDDVYMDLSYRPSSMVSPSQIERDSLVVAHYINYPPYTWVVEGTLPGAFPYANSVGDANYGFINSLRPVEVFTNDLHKNFTIGTLSKANPLPYYKLNFTATYFSKNRINLLWETNFDKKNKSYQIEKWNGNIFVPIITKNAKNVNDIEEYSGVDFQPILGWNIYRIQYKNFLGEINYGSTRKIFVNNTTLKIWPTIAEQTVNLDIQINELKNIQFFVYDATGKLVTKNNIIKNNMTLNVSNLSNGLYYITIKKDGIILATESFEKH